MKKGNFLIKSFIFYTIIIIIHQNIYIIKLNYINYYLGIASGLLEKEIVVVSE